MEKINFTKRSFKEQVSSLKLTDKQKKLIIGLLQSHFYGDVSPRCAPKCFNDLKKSFGLELTADGVEYKIVRINGYIRLF